MKYSIEKTFKEFGQFDKIVTISFFTDSSSHSEYPDLMTGTFYYSPREIAELEDRIHETNNSNGFVKFKEILNEVNDEQKTNLIRIGINCEDISSIFFLPEYNQENKFQSKQIRKLPKPNIIEIDIDDSFKYDSFFINSHERKIADGCKLTPAEEAEYLGISLNFDARDIESINNSEYIDNETGKLKISIKKYFLKSRLRHKQANDEEIEELKEIENQELVHKILVLRKEITRAGIGNDNFDKIKPQIEQIIPFLLEFNEKRLTHGKFPVWLSYERFLHIFLEHVNETNLGGNFEDKTKFQYLIDDIFRLTEIVLDSIEKDIQKHFIERPDKNYKRHGEMAVYYNGDFYVIAINPSGLLMTFYKRQ